MCIQQQGPAQATQQAPSQTQSQSQTQTSMVRLLDFVKTVIRFVQKRESL